MNDEMSDALMLKAEMMFGVQVRVAFEQAEQDRYEAWRTARVRPVDPPAQPFYVLETT